MKGDTHSFRRAAIDPQIELFRDRRECSLREPSSRVFLQAVPAHVALLASVVAYFFQLNR